MLNPILSEGECSLLRSLIEGADSIVLCVHQNPDGDAMGSMLGMGEALRTLGKDPLMVVPDQFPDYLHWLPNSEKVVRYDKRKDFVDTVLKIADLVICLDFNTPSRTDEMAAALCASPAKKVLIDHHPGPEVDTVLCISHPEMSSASELVFRVIWQLGLFDRLGQHYAVPVYCGMMTDTGGFTFNSNDPSIFFIISQLLTQGDAELQALDLQGHIDQSFCVALDKTETAQVITFQRIVSRMTLVVDHQTVAQHMTYKPQTVLAVVVIDIAINLVLVNALGE